MCFWKPVRIKLSCSITTRAEQFCVRHWDHLRMGMCTRGWTKPNSNAAIICSLCRKWQAHLPQHAGFQHQPSLTKQMPLTLCSLPSRAPGKTWASIRAEIWIKELHSLAYKKKNMNNFSLDLTTAGVSMRMFKVLYFYSCLCKELFLPPWLGKSCINLCESLSQLQLLFDILKTVSTKNIGFLHNNCFLKYQ